MNIDETSTPQVIEMEKFVLGSLLLKDGLIIPDVAAILSPDDFYRPEHKLIYNSILKLYHTKVTPNILSLVEDLRTSFDDCGKNLLDKIEIGYVLALTEVAHTTAYSIDYAQRIKEKSEHRKLIRQAEIIVHDAQIGLKSPLDIIADTTNAFKACW
jgi:replicative DNA helicase